MLSAPRPSRLHADELLPDVAASSSGRVLVRDYLLLAGAIARFSPAMRRSRRSLRGGPVLGICNGFQILCEAGLLPGALRPNASLSFVCRDVDLRVERADTLFTSLCVAGQTLTIPVKHGEGCWFADDELLAELEANGQLVLRYEDNPNGSVHDVAASSRRRNVRADAASEHALTLLGSTDGALILRGLIAAAEIETRSLFSVVGA